MRIPFSRYLPLQTKRAVLGALFPRHSRVLGFLNENALLNHWIEQHKQVRQFADRFDYFRYLSEAHCAGPIDYLEFGVAAGDSIREWARLNTHAESRFFGFDTFEGLPEDWPFIFGKLSKGHFDQKGAFPKIPDARVSFRKGLFQDTLDDFLRTFTLRNRLVVHVDSDLYSAALYVLTKLDGYLKRGAIVMFDDFHSPQHDFRAFNDYTASYRRDYKVLAGAGGHFKSAAMFISSDEQPDEPLAPRALDDAIGLQSPRVE